MPLPDTADLSSYGGPKRNYSPIVDPEVDEDAADRNRIFSDASMMTHTAPKAFVSFVTVDGANPTDPVSGFLHDAQWGNAPGDKPVVARTGEGVWTVTYPATVATPLTNLAAELGGESTEKTLNFRRAFAEVECSDGTLRHVHAQVTAANVVTVRGWTAAGALDDLAAQIITVWIW